MTLLCLLSTDANAFNAAMAHFINLNQYEMSIANSVQECRRGRWCCKQCDTEFKSVMRIVTHLLTSCDEESGLSTFSTKSAVRICMVLNELELTKVHQTYVRIGGEDTDSEVRTLGYETNSDTPDLFKDEEEDIESGSDSGKVVRLEKGVKTMAAATHPTPPLIQDISATPPASLSAKAKAEWAFRHRRKCNTFPPLPAPPRDHNLTVKLLGATEIRRLMETNRTANGHIDYDAVLAAYNSSARRKTWKPNAPNAKPDASYTGVRFKYALPPTTHHP